MDKKLITALSVLAGLLILYFLNQYNQNQYSSNNNILVDVVKEDIQKIIISKNEDAIELALVDSIWNISGNDSLIMKDNFVDNFLDQLYELEKQHLVTSKEENWNKYGVDAPIGTHLALIGVDGNTLGYYVFGRSANEYNRSYVRFNKNSDVYLLSGNITYQLQTRPEFWGEKPKEIIPEDSLKVVEPATL